MEKYFAMQKIFVYFANHLKMMESNYHSLIVNLSICKSIYGTWQMDRRLAGLDNESKHIGCDGGICPRLDV